MDFDAAASIAIWEGILWAALYEHDEWGEDSRSLVVTVQQDMRETIKEVQRDMERESGKRTGRSTAPPGFTPEEQQRGYARLVKRAGQEHNGKDVITLLEIIGRSVRSHRMKEEANG